MTRLSTLILIAGLLLTACQPPADEPTVEEHTADFNAAMDSIFDWNVSQSPVRQTYMGIKDRQDEWGPYNDSMRRVWHERTKEQLAFVTEHFDTAFLDDQATITYRLYVADSEEEIEWFDWRHYDYPVNQMFGTHTWIPNFLMSIHTIGDSTDAAAWLSRLSMVDTKIDELIESLELSREAGIVAPAFVFPHVQSDIENLLAGAPVDSAAETDHVLLAHFKTATAGLDSLDDTSRDRMVAEAEELIATVFAPAYDALHGYLAELAAEADTVAGVWKFDEGAAFYRMALENTTTTDYTPDEIFEIGMAEVDRIHGEMMEIAQETGFEGDLQDFFTYMETEERFYFPDTDEGRAAYIQRNQNMIDSMEARLDELFITKPEADLVIKRVEPFREKSAGIAFYQGPAPDGSRPGTYYVNLHDMNNMPKYEMEALSYHEAIPGHHMQISIAQELEGLPKYRTMGTGYTAYSEGWGLYSEFIPKEMGFYEDPYSDFGRLSMELWRACRLVVDVGIHAKKWSRERGIAFYMENTPAPASDCVKMVERHIVMPSQATAYKIGQLKILELRDKAMDALGDDFDIRQFHEVVLTNGPVPLQVLEELVDEYIERTKTV